MLQANPWGSHHGTPRPPTSLSFKFTREILPLPLFSGQVLASKKHTGSMVVSVKHVQIVYLEALFRADPS